MTRPLAALVAAVATWLVLVVALIGAFYPGERCHWQIERGFDDEYHAFTAECLYDHHRARDSEELCQLKAVSRGLVKWTCEKE